MPDSVTVALGPGGLTDLRKLKTDSSGNLLIAGSISLVSPQHVIVDSGTLTSITNPVAVTQSGVWTTGRTWTLASGTDSVSAVQSGTWTVQQGSAPWSVSQSGNWSVRLQDGSGNAITSTGAALDVNLKTSSITLNVSAAQSGTWTVQQGTPPWSVSQSGTWTTGRTWTLSSGTDSVAAVQSGTWTVQQGTPPWSVSQSGTWTVTANIGTTGGLALDTSVNGLLVAQGSTTSGQSGPLVQMATTTNARTDTTGKTNPLSGDTAGLLRISLKDTPSNTNKFLVTADAITFASPQHVILDSGTLTSITNAVTVAQATAANLNATIVFASAQPVTQSGNWSVRLQDGSGNNITSTASALDVNLKSSSITLNTSAAQSGTWTVQQGSPPWSFNLNTQTSGGMTPFRNIAVTSTPVAVKASAGNLYWGNVYNNSNGDVYLHFYDLASGSVTVGTTIPTFDVAIPQGGIWSESLDSAPMTFSTAITIAISTTPNGSTAPSVALVVNLGTK